MHIYVWGSRKAVVRRGNHCAPCYGLRTNEGGVDFAHRRCAGYREQTGAVSKPSPVSAILKNPTEAISKRRRAGKRDRSVRVGDALPPIKRTKERSIKSKQGAYPATRLPQLNDCALYHSSRGVGVVTIIRYEHAGRAAVDHQGSPGALKVKRERVTPDLVVALAKERTAKPDTAVGGERPPQVAENQTLKNAYGAAGTRDRSLRGSRMPSTRGTVLIVADLHLTKPGKPSSAEGDPTEVGPDAAGDPGAKGFLCAPRKDGSVLSIRGYSTLGRRVWKGKPGVVNGPDAFLGARASAPRGRGVGLALTRPAVRHVAGGYL